MIALLTGKLVHTSTEGIILDVGGVGYELQMPLSDLQLLPARNESFTAHVLTYVREDQITLFGFSERIGKRIFKRLIGITGVGPRVALSILSTLTVDELNEAAMTGNTRLLTKVPGIGPKKAKRLVLELKDALGGISVSSSLPMAAAGGATHAPASHARGVWDELRSALLNLGYKDATVSSYIAAVHKDHPDETDVGKLIKYALAHIRGG